MSAEDPTEFDNFMTEILLSSGDEGSTIARDPADVNHEPSALAEQEKSNFRIL